MEHLVFSVLYGWCVTYTFPRISTLLTCTHTDKFIQIFLGAGSVWGNGRLFGGGMKAKSIWKYHRFVLSKLMEYAHFATLFVRLSGYLLFPFFLLTIAIGGGWSHWSTSAMSLVTRIFAYGIAPLVSD
jgi:cytochrome b-561 domain containing protein 2